MKSKKLSLIFSGLMIVAGVIVVSCKKSTTTTPTPAQDTSTTSATDNNNAQQAAHDITNIGSQAIDNGSLSTYRQAQNNSIGYTGNVNVNIDSTNKKITVTFSNFIGNDGITRNGELIYSWTGTARWFKDQGFNVSVSTTASNPYTISNASMGTYTVQINKKTIRNIGPVGGNYTWTDSSNVTLLKAGATTNIQWQGNWTSTLLNTNNTIYNGTNYNGVYPNSTNGLTFIDWAHAIISISGNFNGTASDGETYTGNISVPLVLNLNCTYGPYGLSKYLYVAGQLNFTPTGKATRSINYGTGTCDLTYTVSIGAFSVTITI